MVLEMRPGLSMCTCALRRFRAAFRFDIINPSKPRGFPALLALSAAGWLAFALPTQASPPQTLTGHVPPIAKQLVPVHRLDGGAQLRLSIGLPLRNRERLTNLLEELYQPSHPNFRHFLTADEFAASFGPSQQDYQAVIAFAKAHGLAVNGTHPNRTLV